MASHPKQRTLQLAIAFIVLAGLVLVVVLTTGQGDGDGEASATAELGEKPAVTVPGSPATELEVTDVVEGEGTEAQPGDQVEVQYVGVAQSTGQEFDSSWEGEEPFSFELGAGGVIPGWDEGLVGMREGGRRLLVIPGELAYGPTGQPPDIGPNETLVFAVDLVAVDGGGNGDEEEDGQGRQGNE